VEPWRARLEAGDTDGAWDLFIERYRRLIQATIRGLVEPVDVPDAFADVCQALSADRLERLTRFEVDSVRRARFSTWLITVVHHRTVDWLRRSTGRRRIRAPDGLSDLQRQIFISVFVEHRTHAETCERLRASTSSDITFGCFLKELAETYRIVERVRPRGAMHYLAAPPSAQPVEAIGEHLVAAGEMADRVSIALQELTTEDRAALQLFVVEGLPAQTVAHVLDWPNAKAVYNRVYRALERLRIILEAQGIGLTDL